ncbi:type II toxin-antitoxin system VapC family toxin [Reyranella sp.]|uniref:type II toxin-antitoxin system VapC family toxin n=1 Tax=Reyranella sp. TaxID=1929291 RepID=UPI003D0D5012
MKLLIDSNALVWMAANPKELAAAARRVLLDPDNERFVSTASIWELTIKMSIGKLRLPDRPAAAVEGMAATLLPISLAHIDRLERLPFHHRDPFDRMLVAQAMEDGLTIVTRDRRLKPYGVPLLAA